MLDNYKISLTISVNKNRGEKSGGLNANIALRNVRLPNGQLFGEPVFASLPEVTQIDLINRGIIAYLQNKYAKVSNEKELEKELSNALVRMLEGTTAERSNASKTPGEKLLPTGNPLVRVMLSMPALESRIKAATNKKLGYVKNTAEKEKAKVWDQTYNAIALAAIERPDFRQPAEEEKKRRDEANAAIEEIDLDDLLNDL